MQHHLGGARKSSTLTREELIELVQRNTAVALDAIALASFARDGHVGAWAGDEEHSWLDGQHWRSRVHRAHLLDEVQQLDRVL